MKSSGIQNRQQLLIILVASLGYFVDIYDLILFNVVKKASLLDLGFAEYDLKEVEIFLFNCQMGGMLLGGILWGILGDKKGRLSVLFGSIVMYSLANIANAYVWDLQSYATVRFIAGLGLAGELGAGITLITEIMDKEKRGIGTMIVVTFGALGAVFAALVANKTDWQTSYWVGGVMGMALLLLRIGAMESGMFAHIKKSGIQRGAFLSLFTQRTRFVRYMKCIAMGLPVWFVVGALISLSETYFEKVLHPGEKIYTGTAVMFCYIGLSAGDFFSGLFSQLFRTRLKVVSGYLIFCLLITGLYLFTTHGAGSTYFYILCFLLGTGTGYWALFVTIAAEQFGTNIRATVTSTVPNFVRGAVIPITWGFKELASIPALGVIGSTIVIGMICFSLAIAATLTLPETFGKDLNYTEE
ncbi:MAG: MFS transporter [Candidatus Competibacteraceae bacterium]|nr:MFS transporter [Candidatus Competibacteraceae bacterium]